MPDRGQRPSIFRIGYVRDNGDTVHIGGWGIGLCATACPCHRHPVGGMLVVVEDQVEGTLGLKCFRVVACGCCSPWTADELADVVAYLADLEALTA